MDTVFDGWSCNAMMLPCCEGDVVGCTMVVIEG